MFKKFGLILVLLSLSGDVFGCATEEQLDHCMQQMMFFGNPDTIVPSNDAEMDQQCHKINEGIKCVQDYQEHCLTGFPQKVTGMILTNFVNHIDKRCKQGKERSEFIEQIKCFLPKAKMEPLHICSLKHTRMLEVTNQMTKDDHMNGNCCSYQLTRHCLLDNIKHICSEGHSQYWDEIFDEVASDAMAFACPDVDSKDKCSSLLKAEEWHKLTAIDESTDPSVWNHGMKTPIKYILEMINKFHMD